RRAHEAVLGPPGYASGRESVARVHTGVARERDAGPMSAVTIFTTMVSMTVTVFGLSLFELLALVAAVVLALALWLPPAALRPATTAGAAALAASVVGLAVSGFRWELVPVLAGGAIALGFAVPPLLRRRAGRPSWRARWWLALPGSVACMALILAGAAA